MHMHAHTHLCPYPPTHTHTHTHTHMVHIQGITVAISTTGWWGGTIVVTQLSPIILSSALGAFGILYLIAGVTAMLTVYVLLLIPETKVRECSLYKILHHSCVCVCIYIHMHVRLCARVCVCICVRSNAHMYMYIIIMCDYIICDST